MLSTSPQFRALLALNQVVFFSNSSHLVLFSLELSTKLSNVTIAQQVHQFVLGSNIRSGFTSRPFPERSFVHHENGPRSSQAHIANRKNRYGRTGNDAGGMGRNFKAFSPGPLDLISQGQAGESIAAGRVDETDSRHECQYCFPGRQDRSING